MIVIVRASELLPGQGSAKLESTVLVLDFIFNYKNCISNVQEGTHFNPKEWDAQVNIKLKSVICTFILIL
ncbi:hypothetical protein EB796_004786 [Bugula neritina]|uniref:Uncharacterized protein n=1 Tax=Bugula neritina TaxID=10212 RepID=A0A7J7KGY0_BUGNE|nr:hypothetical protein EB796_004786 [Bugula neritina]